MATWDDVARIALALPETEASAMREGGRQWLVKGKNFVWERPLRASDLRVLGDAAPQGETVGVRVADLDVKEEVLSQSSDAVFTIPHFDGYAAVLVLLDEVELEELVELITESWITRAPKRVLAAYLASQQE
jgi:hypothetical protein